ncbi:MAG: ATP-binding cassette domain-containing protein [Calditrichia bacterium]
MNIQVNEVTKKFRDVPVVNKLSLTAKPGKIIGLLGPNGAGKTTTLRMILNILKPDEGQITFDGQPINRSIRNRIGYLPEERGTYQKYKVIDVLVYFARLKNLSRRKSYVEAVRVLDRFNLIEKMEEPVSHLSKGFQQILQYLITIVHDPAFLILDEPFIGLDPFHMEVIRKSILSMKNEGKAILLSTHQLVEAESLCDYFILIDHGSMVLKGTLSEIQKKYHQNILIVEAPDNLAKLQEINHLQKMTVKNSRAYLYIDESAPINQILTEIINRINVTKIEINKPSLKDIFLETLKSKT